MSLLEAVVLGLVQGLTEFLPVSSTAHLRIIPELFGWRDAGAAYSAVIQLGSSAAVILYFWKDLGRLAAAFFSGLAARRPFETQDARLAWFVLLGTLPLGVMGLTFKSVVETQLRSLYVVAGSLIVLALLLLLAEKLARHERRVDQLTLKDAVVIGLWQALALIPGASRSGTTITGALFLGIRREDAARYSFLLSIPATTLAGVFELKTLVEAHDSPSGAAMVVGTAVAFASSVMAIAGLMRFLRTHTTVVFVAWRVVVGSSLLVLLSMGILQPMSGLEHVAPQEAPERQQLEHQVTD